MTQCVIYKHDRLSGTETVRFLQSFEEMGKHKNDLISVGHNSITSKVIVAVLNRYVTLEGIHNIECSNDGMVYYNHIANDPHYKFTKVKLTKDSMEVLQNFDIECFDFALSRIGDIVFSPRPGHELRIRTSTDDDQRTLYYAPPMIILAVHLTSEDNLMIGLRDNGPKYDLTECSKRQLAVFDSNYKQTQSFEFDKSGNRLFTYLARIATDSDGMIYIINWKNHSHTGNIVGIDKTGNLKFRYEGHHSVNTVYDSFNPEGMVISPSNYVIISDVDNSTLHVLNSNGDVIGLQNTEQFGIKFPYSLSIDCIGNLLIGCITDEENPVSKLHVTKISEVLL